MSRNLKEARQEMERLLDKKLLTPEEFETFETNEFVTQCEFIGYSADHDNYYWYDVRVLDEGFLPDDEEVQTTRYDIYCEKEKD